MKKAKEINYYSDYINTLERSKANSEKKFEQGKLRLDMYDSIKLLWLTYDIRILIAKYSKGDSINELKETYLNLFEDIEDVWIPKAVMLKDSKGNSLDKYILDCHIYMRWLLSFGILFDIPNVKFKVLTDLIKRDEIQDALYDFLISSRVINWEVSENMSIKKPVNSIKDVIAIEVKEECENAIKQYLTKEWYKTYRYFGFYNTHKKPEDMFLFYGYWAFEVAAIVKIKNLDDSSFRKNKYYPDKLL